MSVIFKTLKKLNTESADKENSKNKLVRRKRIFFFKNALYSPSYILLLLLILTVIGAGTLYGYYHLRETKGENTKDFVIPNIDVRQSTDVHTIESSEDEKVKRLDWTKHPESSQIEYIPPQSNDNRVKNYTSNKPYDAEIPSIIAKKHPPKVRNTIEKKSVSKTIIEKADQSIPTEDSAVPDVEKIFLKNAKKNAKIARLVGDIRWEMEHGNDKRTEELLDELATLKGQNNSYVLKLKAVWHIRNKEFERAKDLLKIVLTKNKIDQEAGINMAIIEMNTKQMENAYQRLAKLQVLYPENTRIAEIMQSLKLLFNKTQKNYLSKNKDF